MADVLALSRDAILGVVDLEVELLEVPEWNGSVYVRGLNGRERADYMEELVDMDAAGKARARIGASELGLAKRGLCDENGARLFSTPQDVEKLSGKSARALKRIAEAVSRLSGLDDGAIEDAEKNSDELPSDDSSTLSLES